MRAITLAAIKSSYYYLPVGEEGTEEPRPGTEAPDAIRNGTMQMVECDVDGVFSPEETLV